MELEVFYVHLIVRWCIAVIGVVSNLLGLVVLLQPVFRKKSTFVYLSALAITDTAVLVWLPIHMTIWNVKPPLMATALLVYLQQCSSSLLVAVTIDRCVVVFYPLNSRTLCTRRRALIVMLILYMLVPLPQLLGLSCTHNKQTIPDSCYKIQAHIYVGMYAFLPFLILLVANISIIVRLRRRKRKLVDMTHDNSGAAGDTRITSAEKDDKRINIMLIFTTVAFFVFLTPGSLFRVIYILPYDKLYDNNTVEILVDIGLVNHAINMFIYCATGRGFREEGFKVVRRLWNRMKYWTNINRRLLDGRPIVSSQNGKHCVITQTTPLKIGDHSDSPGVTDTSSSV